jgi:hypothetical protein
MVRWVVLAWIVCGSCCLAASPAPIDVLDAEAQGLVGVKYVPNGAHSAQILVQNKSDKPLTLRLPAAFAGVPVLAQALGGGLGGAGLGGAGLGGAGAGVNGAGGTQAVGGGGGMGGGGMGMPGMGGGMMGGGMFSVPPEKTRAIPVATVCLEYGKPEPTSRHPYKLVAIASFSSDPQLAAILELFGRGEIPQKVAQAAAWHVANRLPWERLAAEQIDRAGGFPDEPFFSPAELMAAHRVVSMTAKQATEQPAASPGSTGS